MTKNRVTNWALNNGALVGLIALCIALFIATPYFLTVTNLLNVGIQAATVAILAFGMTFVIVTAGIDLSVGSVAALGAMVSAYMFSTAGLPGWLTLLIGLGVGALAGAICGMATAWGKIPSFIATLAMMSIARGLTLVISQGSPIETAPSVNFFGSDVAGLPVPIIMMVIAGLLCWFILERTVLGRSMYAIGGNLEAARLSGLPVKRIQIAVFALSGFFAAWAGMVMAGRLESAQPQAGTGYELDAIAAVVIGGASLSGGQGKATGTLVGAILLAVIRNGLNLLNVSSFWQQIVIGLVIALAVGFDVFRNKTAN
ncbi:MULTISPECIES: ABC transporter permease [Corynebacterium]|uniref:Sugar ABC transporter permease n=4 Tax=Corynebacterium TaxID=1716 RepID=A0ACC4UD70_9CORY|nr:MULTISPECIES: ABC transporter permease [Corynebacterium]KKO81261.1 sugar ABC transporter permease [Corynebacterium minutissimum]MTD92591.1 ABC transporter permease [Corynebacterium aurimucosum]OFK66429.1 sugar ABC transporter permease [Corynebacterium sp. HMSC076G08]OFK70213.1 sugar ABC transporter permease [Corynebacterium sp. HMSC074A09]OFN37644.1 sugar ABC transporter permease [Corynebacterium sp. HMSC072A04]